ncbi:MAG TPA: hypothetical protein VGN42_01435 [Pirellulales bacterium]|jgi:hypothetical protein|nr:hypothetical protein [Pirellulales bacterium]
MNRTSRSVVTDFQLTLRFENVRKQLLEASCQEPLGKALAFYAVPNDRHLPLALIQRTIRQLLATPLDELHAVPGIGPKKLESLIDLLQRAAGASSSTAASRGENDGPIESCAAALRDAEGVGGVSEAAWEQWRGTIRRRQLGHETLGRFAASLRRLPRTLWARRLEAYLDLTLAELNELRGHGEKRVAAILEIFGKLHKLLLRFDEQPHLSVHLLPSFATRLERWLVYRWEHAELPQLDEIDSFFVGPLLDQLLIDGGETHVELVRDRLNPTNRGLGNAARRLGLARGRAYELLGETLAIIDVRWPEGRSLAWQLLDRMESRAADSEATARTAAAVGLFFRSRARQAKAPPVRGNPSVHGDADEPGQLLQTAVFCAT